MPSDQKPVVPAPRPGNSEEPFSYTTQEGATLDWWRTRPAPQPPEDVAGMENDLTAVYMAGRRDGRDELAATITNLVAKLGTAREEERATVVAWLRSDNSLCDCFAREEGECACGAWDDNKSRPLLQIAADIEAGEHIRIGARHDT
jgi:hypothetical protein